MAAYSMDLRLRVLRDSDAGMPSQDVAEKYAVSRAWVDRLKQRRRETGEITPRRQTRWRTPILHAQLDQLAALIHEQPDRTLAELQAALRTPASLPTLCRTIKQLGFPTAQVSSLTSSKSSRRRSPRATSSSWTTCRVTRVRPSAGRLKTSAPTCGSSRNTAPT